jgi:cephalosporin hydroxylase
MSLKDLVDNSRTDKDTVHSYLNLYDQLLSDKKLTAKNILEIGIHYGGSIKLWSDYFVNATIYAIDLMDIRDVWKELINKDNIILYTSTDAYDETYFNYLLLEKNIKFDFILDDGPHTLESMKTFINLYSQLLTDDGILIIEDVQSYDWLEGLKMETPDNLKQYIKTYDLRENKNRYDDIVFTINKSIKN